MIHNISIATDDDVIQFGDDVNIYPVYHCLRRGNTKRIDLSAMGPHD